MDLVRTLPDDWRERVLAFEPDPSVGPLVQRLQKIVEVLGDEAILIDLVQDLAALACLRRERNRLEFYGLLLDRLRAAAGEEWPVRTPLEERSVERKTALALVADLDSIEAEWLVLDRLITRGWRPRESARTPSTPDWLVERTGALPIEVKFKKNPSYVPMYWASMMKGIGMLPSASFIPDFKWTWKIPAAARDGDVFILARSFLERLPDVERVLRTGLAPFAEPTPLLAGDGFELAAHCGFIDGRQAFEGVDFDLKINDLVLTLSAHAFPLKQLGVWEAGEIFATWERSYDEAVAKDLTAIFTRLNISKQVSRSPDVLVVLRWQVSPDLMRGVNAPWLRGFWNDLTASEDWPMAVLWPVGVPGAGDYRWIENDGARSVLADDAASTPPDPAEATARTRPPGGYAVTFLTDLWDASQVDDVTIELRDLTRRQGAMIDNLAWRSVQMPGNVDKMLVTLSGDGPISRDQLLEAARLSGVEIEDIQVLGPSEM